MEIQTGGIIIDLLDKDILQIVFIFAFFTVILLVQLLGPFLENDTIGSFFWDKWLVVVSKIGSERK